MRALDLILACLITAALVAVAARLAGPVERAGPARAIDGDSLALEGRVIRLAGIDAPELHQTCTIDGRPWSCGEAARAETARLVAAGPVTCRVSGRDRFGRDLARCSVAGRDLGGHLVRNGLALAYGDYAAEEREAQAGRLGLWRGAFEPPSQWRRSHPAPHGRASLNLAEE